MEKEKVDFSQVDGEFATNPVMDQLLTKQFAIASTEGLDAASAVTEQIHIMIRQQRQGKLAIGMLKSFQAEHGPNTVLAAEDAGKRWQLWTTKDLVAEWPNMMQLLTSKIKWELGESMTHLCQEVRKMPHFQVMGGESAQKASCSVDHPSILIFATQQQTQFGRILTVHRAEGTMTYIKQHFRYS